MPIYPWPRTSLTPAPAPAPRYTYRFDAERNEHEILEAGKSIDVWVKSEFIAAGVCQSLNTTHARLSNTRPLVLPQPFPVWTN